MAAADQIHQDPQGTGETVIMDVMKTVTVKPHEATDDTQLDLKVNDIVYVLEQDETGWWGGHKEGEETTGWFPGSCVRPFFEPGTLGHQQLAGVLPEEHVWHQGIQPTPACADEGLRTQHSALETEARSPVRRSLLVASPLRGSHHERAGGSTMAIPGTPVEPSAQDAAAGSSQPSDINTTSLATENTKLKQEVSELNDTIKMMKRQSDVDRRNCSEMEAAMEAERARREEAERRLKAEDSEKEGLLNEAAVLRQQMEKLEKERQDNKAAMKRVEDLYKSMLEDKDVELRRTSEHLETHRRSLQSDKQRVRSLEEQLQVLQAQLEEARQSKEPTEAVDHVADHAGAGLCQRRLSVESAVTAVVDPGARQEAQTVVADETRRRLFSSTASDAAAPAPASGDLAVSPPAEATRGRALTAACRAKTLPLASLGQQLPAPAAGFAPRGAGAVHRPPEPPRAASSAPRIANHSAGSPGRLGHARSTGDLEPRQRAASVDHCLEDAPPRGCVADKVTMFEQRCQTPRRDASELQRLRAAPRSEPHDVRLSRNSREDRTARPTPPALPMCEDRAVRATPPALPRQAGAAAPAQAPAAQQAPAISVTPPAQAGAPAPQASNFLQVPAPAPQPGAPMPSIQAMAAHFQARPTQEQVLSGRPGARPRGLDLNEEAEEEEEAGVDQVDMGMSPICRPQPREASSQQPSGGMLHEPAQAAPMQACGGGAGAAGVAPGSARGASAAAPGSGSTSARQAASRESAVPEISVLERIRKLEVR